MSLLLPDKVGIVTGGGLGMGRSAALLAAREGAKVVVADINPETGRKVVQEITQAGGTASFVQTDVTSDEQVQAMVAYAVETYGRLDWAFNNAGVQEAVMGYGGDVPLHIWDKVIAINLTGVWYCMKHEAAAMIAGGRRGSIVNNVSVSGLTGQTDTPAYVASKHGAIGLTRYGALEWADRYIRVNATCPGTVKTEGMYETGMAGMTPDEYAAEERAMALAVPLRRFGVPRDVAEAAVWLASDRSDWVTGHSLVIDGGNLAAWQWFAPEDEDVQPSTPVAY
jgi:NAD(P)-dependent dehydrogenase (short-subunit alcohol dehydrogenase family)